MEISGIEPPAALSAPRTAAAEPLTTDWMARGQRFCGFSTEKGHALKCVLLLVEISGIEPPVALSAPRTAAAEPLTMDWMARGQRFCGFSTEKGHTLKCVLLLVEISGIEPLTS